MSDPLKRMEPGTPCGPGEGPFNSQFHNLAIESILDYLARKRTHSGPDGALDIGKDELFIVNNSGSDLDQFSVVGIGTVASNPTDVGEDEFLAQTNVNSAAPTATKPFAILTEPCLSGSQFGARAVMTGLAKCLIAVSNSSHTYADATTSDYTKLTSQSAAGPAFIIWKESGTGDKWALVLLLGIAASGGLTYTFTAGSTGSDFNVTQDAFGNVEYDLPAASLTASGKVTTSTQQFSGNKWFQDGIQVHTTGDASDDAIVVTGEFISGGGTYSARRPYLYFNQLQSLLRTAAPTYSSGTTYNFGDMVIGSNSNVYFSKIDSNTGHDPTTSGTQWSSTPVQSLLILTGGDQETSSQARYCVLVYDSLLGSTLYKGYSGTLAAAIAASKSVVGGIIVD